MPDDIRIVILVVFPIMPWPPRDSDSDSFLRLEQLADELCDEGIRLVPCLPGPLWYPGSSPLYFEELLTSGDFDRQELRYVWRRWERDLHRPSRRWYNREYPREIIGGIRRFMERRLVSGVVLLTRTTSPEEPIRHGLEQICELIPGNAVLQLEMGRGDRENWRLFSSIRSLRFPESQDELRAILLSFADGHRKESRYVTPPEAAPPSAASPRTEPADVTPPEAAPPSAASPRPELETGKEPVGATREAVHLGASAPTRARPGDQFTARFSAYHPAFAEAAKKALKQPGTRTSVNQSPTTWKHGEEVRVVLVGEHVTASPTECRFVWHGTHETVQFDVTVDDRVTERKRVLLGFDVYIQDAIVARVRLRLTIDSRPGFLEQLFVPEEQSFAGAAPQTAYASYAAVDKTEVMSRIDAISQHAGIRFFTECLSLDQSTGRRGALQKVIAAQDLFMLFWSRAAAKCPAVKWEWTTALKRPGRDYMEAQRLRPNDPEPVLPPELQSLGIPKGRSNRMQNTDKRYFVVGCVLSIFVAGLVIWAFILGTLTPDQRMLMRVLLSLFSGFAAGSFVGALTVKARGLLPGVVATATGGFGVWLLTAFVMFPAASSFSVVVQPHGPAGVLAVFKQGTVSLQVGDQLQRRSIDEDGQARFPNISGEFQGKRVPVGVQIPGFRMKDPSQVVELQRGEALAVPMMSEDP